MKLTFVSFPSCFCCFFLCLFLWPLFVLLSFRCLLCCAVRVSFTCSMQPMFVMRCLVINLSVCVLFLVSFLRMVWCIYSSYVLLNKNVLSLFLYHQNNTPYMIFLTSHNKTHALTHNLNLVLRASSDMD